MIVSRKMKTQALAVNFTFLFIVPALLFVWRFGAKPVEAKSPQKATPLYGYILGCGDGYVRFD